MLASCGGPPPDPRDARVLPPRFADADPHPFDAPAPLAYPVHGIDVSRFQSRIDWSEAKRAGVNFVFMKATEGGDRIDPIFAGNWDAAAEAGVARGAYHFYYFCTPPEVQARWFIENVPRTPGALPPVLDLEWNPFSPTCTYRPPPEIVRAQARIFLDIVARHYGQRPIIYTTPDFWETNDIAQMGEEFWLRSTAATPGELYPGIPWRFWQYSATGRVPGLDGDTDLNAFSGSTGEWRAWLSRRAIR
nr:glycoside hydrolase family 25 protein [Palleronia aestuarii]